MKKILMIGGPVLLLLLVAAKMFLMPAAPPPDEKALAKEPGPIYTMAEPFVVNLSDGADTPHFAKVGVALRLSMFSAAELPAGGHAKAGEPVVIEADPELRDIVIATLQAHSSEELSHSEGREKVKKEIVKEVNKHTDLKILDVYYTEFAVQ
ncbi:MAG: flagellar basal body-associated FliL family protein [Thermoleophilia bacterium]|nr:flagellar basal body-associated FliL family protein [Thermoleophilia bacterium]